ncbi:hypothetical protein GCM10010968_03270 [Agrococcus terreus]|uniref:Uncharacterized protein n=2 Tax=Agrococcus terreus TaxID=574649 RepID=A0ABQ2KCW8_9MICO|nr:hypothetical protein GCM10010968_03270 [Agrococcus terreus]
MMVCWTRHEHASRSPITDDGRDRRTAIGRARWRAPSLAEEHPMTTTHSTEQTAPATEAGTPTTAAAAPRARRWPWIVALVVVAALGATGTALGFSQASAAQAQLAETQSELGDVQTRADILGSSLDLIRDHRDRLQVQLDELLESQEG